MKTQKYIDFKVSCYDGVKRVSIGTNLLLNKYRRKNNQPSYRARNAAAWESYEEHRDGLYVSIQLCKAELLEALALLEQHQ